MIITIVAILYLLLRTLAGYHRGIMQTLVRTIGLVVVWLLAIYFSKYLGQIISPFVSEPLNQFINDSIGHVTQIKDVGSQAIDASTKTVASSIAFFAIIAIGTLIVNLIGRSLHGIRRVNYFGFIDGIFGAILSLAVGLFIIYLSSKILTVIPWQNGFIADQLNQAPWIGRVAGGDLIDTNSVINWLVGDGGPANVIKEINKVISTNK